MIRRYELETLCIVLSLLMLVDFTVFNPAPAFSALDEKRLVGAGVGAVAGAGIALAALLLVVPLVLQAGSPVLVLL